MNEIQVAVMSVLKSDPRLVNSEGTLLKNATQVLIRNLDSTLIEALLDNPLVRSTFFVSAGKATVLNQQKLIEFISNKNFLPDSFTIFKNKVGLTSNTDFLTQSSEVVLSWPFKDCSVVESSHAFIVPSSAGERRKMPAPRPSAVANS